MKKGFFGYNVSEVDVMVNSLREENESLNATITTLKTQIKNSEIGGAKANLLEANLKSTEENLSQLTEEKNGLLSQISTLTADAKALELQNTQLKARMEQLHLQNEELIAATSDLTVAASDYEGVKDELESAKAALVTATSELKDAQEKVKELEKARSEIARLEEELAAAMVAVDELAKIRATEKKQQENLNQASEISFRAYHEMSKMRNEAIENMHEQLKEYYQFVNENSVKMRNAIEERQTEYNQMIRDFFTKASEFRISLSGLEDKYSSMADYSINIDKISGNMNEIMNKFIQESDTYLKKKEEQVHVEEEPQQEATATFHTKENSAVKPIVFRIS